MTLQTLMNRLREDLAMGPVDVGIFVAGFYLHDVEAGQPLAKAFGAKLLRGRLRTNLTKFNGHISQVM